MHTYSHIQSKTVTDGHIQLSARLPTCPTLPAPEPASERSAGHGGRAAAEGERAEQRARGEQQGQEHRAGGGHRLSTGAPAPSCQTSPVLGKAFSSDPTSHVTTTPDNPSWHPMTKTIPKTPLNPWTPCG